MSKLSRLQNQKLGIEIAILREKLKVKDDLHRSLKFDYDRVCERLSAQPDHSELLKKNQELEATYNSLKAEHSHTVSEVNLLRNQASEMSQAVIQWLVKIPLEMFLDPEDFKVFMSFREQKEHFKCIKVLRDGSIPPLSLKLAKDLYEAKYRLQ